jgi:hypothetical protein
MRLEIHTDDDTTTGKDVVDQIFSQYEKAGAELTDERIERIYEMPIVKEAFNMAAKRELEAEIATDHKRNKLRREVELQQKAAEAVVASTVHITEDGSVVTGDMYEKFLADK